MCVLGLTVYSVLFTFPLQSPHALYSSPLRPSSQPAFQSSACPSIRGQYVWQIGLEPITSLFCPVSARSREKQFCPETQTAIILFLPEGGNKAGERAVSLQHGKTKIKFPTALACVCGMKHFPKGVGLVFHLQVGETELGYHKGEDGTTCHWSHSPTPPVSSWSGITLILSRGYGHLSRSTDSSLHRENGGHFPQSPWLHLWKTSVARGFCLCSERLDALCMSRCL